MSNPSNTDCIPTTRFALTSPLITLLLVTTSLGDLVVNQDDVWVGSGFLAENVTNHGWVIGHNLVISEGFTVTGAGSFANTRIDGVYAPGNSPSIINNMDAGFGDNAVVQFELGGTTPGSGSNNHDQINDSGEILMGSNTTIEILSFNSFVPMPDDEFVVLTWQEGLSAEFLNVVVDSFFTNNDIGFELDYANLTGAGNLTLRAIAIPEPSAFLLLALLTVVRSGIGWFRRTMIR